MSDTKYEVSLLLDFKCPECGGYKFGTNMINNQQTGHCHNFNSDTNMLCQFTWNRATQDEDVFTEDTK